MIVQASAHWRVPRFLTTHSRLLLRVCVAKEEVLATLRGKGSNTDKLRLFLICELHGSGFTQADIDEMRTLLTAKGVPVRRAMAALGKYVLTGCGCSHNSLPSLLLLDDAIFMPSSRCGEEVS